MLRALNETEDKLNARLKRLYKREAAEFTKDIAAYYAKYGKDNVIEFRTLLLNLDEADRDKLYSDWEAFEVKYPQYAHLGDVRKSIYKLNRLQGLQENVTLRGLRMGAFTEAEIRAHLESLADSTYTEAWEFLYGSKPVVINKDLARRYVGIDWTGGGDFSSRIWADTNKLSQTVNTKLAIGFARGTKYDTLSRMLATEIVTKSVRNAYRVAYTEGTYIYNETNAGAFEDAGAKTYIFKTAQDSIRSAGACSRRRLRMTGISSSRTLGGSMRRIEVYTADYCPHCRQAEALLGSEPDVTFINCMECPTLAKRRRIEKLPTLIYYVDNTEAGRTVGVTKNTIPWLRGECDDFS